jgi:hypothetical protein
MIVCVCRLVVRSSDRAAREAALALPVAHHHAYPADSPTVLRVRDAQRRTRQRERA